jgi:hypothetical protein
MSSKQTIFDQYDIDDIRDMFTYGWSTPDGWEKVSEEFTGYDEGSVTTEYVYKHIDSDRYFAYDHVSNSWADYDEPFELDDVREVKPVQVTVTKYESI